MGAQGNDLSSSASMTCLLLGGVCGIAAFIKGIGVMVTSNSLFYVSTNASNGGGDRAKAKELETEELLNGMGGCGELVTPDDFNKATLPVGDDGC
jgi:hypothetical protein